MILNDVMITKWFPSMSMLHQIGSNTDLKFYIIQIKFILNQHD